MKTSLCPTTFKLLTVRWQYFGTDTSEVAYFIYYLYIYLLKTGWDGEKEWEGAEGEGEG